jgi:CDP-diacylglycerol--glycerol-3-phosphate 3-phosphatidyltransferase
MIQLPNIITLLRIAGSLGLLLCDVTGVVYWIIYGLCGISDMLDGYLARKLHCESKTGALLDSLADIVFVACCCIKLIPALTLPNWLWIWALVIVFIKVINQISALVIFKKCVFPHTIVNKVTGFLLFVGIPVIFFVESLIPIVIIAIFATFAAIQEGHLIRTRKNTRT